MSLSFKLLVVLLTALGLFGAGVAAGIKVDDGQKARDELVRETMEKKAINSVKTVILQASTKLEAKKASVEAQFVPITKEVDRDILANPDLYSRACFSSIGLRELNEAAGYGSDAGRELAPAVPAAATP